MSTQLFDLTGKVAIVTGAATFLASKTSDYANDHIILVDGGWMAR